jgi:hypothetical protein
MTKARGARILGRSVAAVALVLGATACGPGSEVGTPSATSNLALQGIVDEAVSSGAAAPQMDVLNTALDAGVMTFEDLSGLLADLGECVAPTGATMTVLAPREEISGVMAPYFTFSAPATDEGTQAMGLVEECLTKYYSFASAFYMSQPSSVQAYEDTIIRDREVILACLRSHRVVIDDNATTDEIIQAVVDDFDNADFVPDWQPCLAGEAIVQPR